MAQDRKKTAMATKAAIGTAAAGGIIAFIENFFGKGSGKASFFTELFKSTRGRDDEVKFFTSLADFLVDHSEITSKENIIMLFNKWKEMVETPNVYRNSIDLDPRKWKDDEKKKLGQLEKRASLAKGIVFLFHASDDEKNSKKIWESFFMGIEKFSDEEEKKKFLEERILIFGRNNQEGKTLWGRVEQVNDWLGIIDPRGTDKEYKGPVDQLTKTFKKAFPFLF